MAECTKWGVSRPKWCSIPAGQIDLVHKDKFTFSCHHFEFHSSEINRADPQVIPSFTAPKLDRSSDQSPENQTNFGVVKLGVVS